MKEQGQHLKKLAMVVRQEEIAPDIYSMWVKSEAAQYAEAGQFVNLFSRDASRLLPRPLSICEINPDRTELRFVYRVNGAGTKEFSDYAPGDWIELMGPLGNGFPEEKISQEGPVILIGGGIGVAPMLQLAKEITCKKIAILGFVSVPFLKEEFDACGCRTYVTTETGTIGVRGNVMGALLENSFGAEVIYACGPKPMLSAVKQYATGKGIKCYVSLEEHMACGVGACLGCVCETVSKDEHYQVNKKCVCKDGPVFLAEEVIL